MSILYHSDSESASEQSALPAALAWRVKPTDERRNYPAICNTNLHPQHSISPISSPTTGFVDSKAPKSLGATGSIGAKDPSLLISSNRYEVSSSSSSFSDPINYLSRLTISRDQTRRKDYRRERLSALKKTESTNFDSVETSLTHEERVENFKKGLAALEAQYCKLFAHLTVPQAYAFKVDNSTPTYPSRDYPTRKDIMSPSTSHDHLIPIDDKLSYTPRGPTQRVYPASRRKLRFQYPEKARINSSTAGSGLPPDIMHGRPPEEALGWCEDWRDPIPVKHLASLRFTPEQEGDRKAGEGLGVETPSSSWIVLYVIRSALHVSQPKWVNTRHGYSPSNATLLKDLDGFLDKNNDVMLVLYKSYSTVSSAMQGIPLDDHSRSHRSDSMYLRLTPPMIEAMESMLKYVPSFDSMFPNLQLNGKIPHPYLPLYFLYPLLDEVIPKLEPVFAERTEALCAFLEESQALEYRRAREMISRGCVNRSTMPYLVHPGQILVERKGQDTIAFMATSWATYNSQLDSGTVENTRPKQPHVRGSTFDKTQTLAPSDIRYHDLWQVSGWNWKFNGTFEKKFVNIDILVPATDAEVRIADLNVHPLEFADNDTRDLLEKRGKTFWKCRLKKFVSYTGPDENDTFADTSDRYMVDYRTYQRLHPESNTRAGRDGIEKATMLDDDPPQDDTIFLFPTKLIGFNFRLKKWMQLLVDRISEPEWNKKAFDSLVIEDETKHLLKALVAEQIAAEKSTDIISGKGNGLLILLHGGPGTGKTFTAEGVAEMTEKPLYRVTCGDIGTKPDEVEKYLESVLHLGKIWDCVVLMDEADVFLEERSLTDLQRNALVSVFLRVLEYYDGILILTSNRVGTFDQAFKSRIQLALHYSNLSISQRRKIWRNFITRLKELGGIKIDYDDINDNMDELGKEEMNGRQIRNSITIARQLAQFDKEVFSYKHLKRVIGVSKRFETYLNSVNHGYTDDQLAQDAGLRFHEA